jgi:hypothetical protein
MVPRLRFVLIFVALWVIAFAFIFMLHVEDGDQIFLISIGVLAASFVVDGFIQKYQEKRGDGKG